MRAKSSRISVVGTTGSGKTRVSKELQALLHLPLYELDRMRLNQRGEDLPKDEFFAAVQEVTDRDDWIIDGHYRDIRELIWRRSQVVVWLNHPLGRIFWRVLRRGTRKKYGSRKSEPEDHHVSASWSRRWKRLVNTLHERKEYKEIIPSLEARGSLVIELRSIREHNELYFRLRSSETEALSRAPPLQGLRVDREATGLRRRTSGKARADREGREAIPTVIFELFGLPGAGKTTLTDAIGSNPEVKTRSRLSEKWGHYSFLGRAAVFLRTIADFRLALAAVRLAAAARLNRTESFSRLVRLLFIKHWFRSQSRTLLLDQGPMQGIWSALYASNCTDPDPRVIAPLLRAFYKGTDTTIILLNVETTVAARRVATRARGGSRFDALPRPEIGAHMARSISLVTALVQAARMVGLTVHELNGTEPIPVLAEELKELLAQRKESHRAFVR